MRATSKYGLIWVFIIWYLVILAKMIMLIYAPVTQLILFHSSHNQQAGLHVQSNTNYWSIGESQSIQKKVPGTLGYGQLLQQKCANGAPYMCLTKR